MNFNFNFFNFNIQRFGSNDTVTADNFLTLGYERADETFQNYKIPNPKAANTAAGIREVMQADINAAIFLDSKTDEVMNSDVAKVGTAFKTERTTRDLDLS